MATLNELQSNQVIVTERRIENWRTVQMCNSLHRESEKRTRYVRFQTTPTLSAPIAIFLVKKNKCSIFT